MTTAAMFRILAVATCVSVHCLALSPRLCGQTTNEQKVSAEPTTENWYGVLKTPRQWLRTSLHFSTRVDGTLEAHCVVHDQKAAKLKLTKIERKDKRWHLEFLDAKTTYDGQESDDGKRVEGTFRQSNTDFALTFERTDVMPVQAVKSVYRGEMDAFVRKLPMQLRVIEGEQVDGKQLVLVDSLSEGFGAFVGTIESEGDQLVVSVPALAATWKAKAKMDDATWDGTWQQGLVPLPLKFTREAAPLELDFPTLRRPQTPKPPFPYEATEVTLPSAEGVTLAGTLLMPKSDRPVPAVVLVSGSGPQDRDESLMDHQPFLVIADFLARKGIAVLRYDDRGFAQSTGNFDAATAEDFAVDAEAAWKHLANHSAIDKSRIGFLGHSEGSSHALIVAARNPQVAFLILMAGAGWDGRKIVIEQTVEMTKRQGSTETTLAATRKLMEQHSDLVLAKKPENEFGAEVEKMVKEFFAVADVPEGEREVGEAAMTSRFKQLNTDWYRDFLVRDPSKLLSEITCPIFAIWGSEDVQVPAAGNRDAMQQAAHQPPHPLTRFEILPKANHLLQPCKTGTLDEYEAIETTIDLTALKQFAEFILSPQIGASSK